MENVPPPLPATRTDRRHAVTFKLIFIAALVLLLQLPLHFINSLRQERMTYWGAPQAAGSAAAAASPAPAAATAFDAYRMVERAVKHGVLVHALVFTAYFLFEILAGLRLHAVHYGLVGAALLAVVHGVLFVVLRMEDFALLAGTGALFAALAAVMFFTRHIDWFSPAEAHAGGAR